jgi:hypothetical protein
MEPEGSLLCPQELAATLSYLEPDESNPYLPPPFMINYTIVSQKVKGFF